MEKTFGFRGSGLTKEVNRKYFILNGKADRKNSYPGSYRLSEIASKMFMFKGNLGVELKTWKIGKASLTLSSGQLSEQAKGRSPEISVSPDLSIHLLIPPFPCPPDPHCLRASSITKWTVSIMFTIVSPVPGTVPAK